MYQKKFQQFLQNDGTIDFYFRINCFVKKDFVILDLGAGRAEWYEDDTIRCRRSLRTLKGKCKKIIAADTSFSVKQNNSVDSSVVINPNEALPFEDGSFDLIIADYVLEHIENPKSFVTEIDRLLKTGGLFAARTPHKFSYVAIFSRLVKNKYHSKILKYVQPHRKEIDVFPTRYKLNSLKKFDLLFQNFYIQICDQNS